MSTSHSSPLDRANERLNAAFTKLESVMKNLETSDDAPVSAKAKEAIQAEITATWQTKCDALINENSALKSDNETVHEENVRLSNQLQEVQQEYLELQQVSEQVADELDDQAKQLDLIAHVQAAGA